MNKTDTATVGYVNGMVSQMAKKLRNGKTPKKRMQFSQKVCVFGLVLIAVTLAANFVLLWVGRQHMSDLSITIVTVFGGFATGGYFALSGARDLSRNKHADKLNKAANAPNEQEDDNFTGMN